MGLPKVDEKPDGFDAQVYVCPFIGAAPMVELPFIQTLVTLPVFAAGRGVTVITTVFDLLQPVAVTVSVRR